MNETIQCIVKYYISRLEKDTIAADERERLEELLQQYYLLVITNE
jgi:hypothetical protein